MVDNLSVIPLVYGGKYFNYQLWHFNVFQTGGGVSIFSPAICICFPNSFCHYGLFKGMNER